MEGFYVEINGFSLFGERGISVCEIVVVPETSYFNGSVRCRTNREDEKLRDGSCVIFIIVTLDYVYGWKNVKIP